MPQEFHVVRCYSCETFQVQIVKKVNKYQCKMCGEKQSVKKEYAKGSGKDCRLHVQKLNQMRVELQGQLVEKLSEIVDNTEETFDLDSVKNTSNEPTVSKWSEYIPEPEKMEDDSETELLDSRYTFERPTKRKSRGRKSENNAGNSAKKSKYNFKENLVENEQNSFAEDRKLMKKPMDFTNKQQKIEKVTKWNDFEAVKPNDTNFSDSDNENMEENDCKNNIDKWNNFKIIKNDIKEKKETKINNTKAINIVGKAQNPIKKFKWDSYVTKESDDEIESNQIDDQTSIDINKSLDNMNHEEINSYEKSTKLNAVEFQNENIRQITKEQIFKVHESDDDLDNILDF